MQFTFSAATAFLAFVGSAIAQTEGFNPISAPAKDQEVIADGKTTTAITWSPTAEYNGQKVSILLLQGASQTTLEIGDNVASSIDSALGSFDWTPEASIAGFATYGLKLQLDSDPTIFQYSFPFKIAAGSSSGNDADDSSSGGSSTTTADGSTPTVVETNGNVVNDGNEYTPASAWPASTAPTATPVSGSGSGSSSSGNDSTPAGSSAAQTTLATATGSAATGSATGGSAAGGSTTGGSASGVVTAGAARVAVGGLAAVGGVMALLAL